MSLPQYFAEDELGNPYFSIGDRVHGCITLSNNSVEYIFNDGNSRYSEDRKFSSEKLALNFTKRFAAYMRQCEKRNSVPTLATFKEFNA